MDYVDYIKSRERLAALEVNHMPDFWSMKNVDLQKAMKVLKLVGNGNKAFMVDKLEHHSRKMRWRHQKQLWDQAQSFIRERPELMLTSKVKSEPSRKCFMDLPPEIRDMIYHEMWEVSGRRQHVFETEDGSALGHFPCVLAPGEKDTRNEDFEALWDRQQERRPRSLVVDAPWAERMASPWHEHWKCEEAMRAGRASGSKTGTLFLPSLLACRRMYVPLSVLD